MSIDHESKPRLTEDQIAINDYFASASYLDTARNPDSETERTYVMREWVSDESPLLSVRSSPLLSFVLGLAGLNLLLIVLGALSPVLIEAFEDSIGRPGRYAFMMFFIQSVILPPIIAFSVATVTPMFWYGSVLLRFLTGALMVVPGCVAFYAFLVLVEGRAPHRFLFDFSGVMFTQFLVAGVVALIVQMWSPWTLSHARQDDRPLPPLGMRAMLELTCVAAIGCSVFVVDGLNTILEGIMFFAAMGLISSLAVIGCQIAFLREGPRSYKPIAIAILGAFGMAYLMCAFFAVMEFGWYSIQGLNGLYVVAMSLYGATLILAVMAICLWWLHICGWRCVNRRESQRTAVGTAASF